MSRPGACHQRPAACWLSAAAPGSADSSTVIAVAVGPTRRHWVGKFDRTSPLPFTERSIRSLCQQAQDLW